MPKKTYVPLTVEEWDAIHLLVDAVGSISTDMIFRLADRVPRKEWQRKVQRLYTLVFDVRAVVESIDVRPSRSDYARLKGNVQVDHANKQVIIT